jgi:RHH-type proline utilization regulon transcriptional repressor/proline dehydrogenase/delta 1-pyrroline-5-carboxylate dehydrogenase
MQNKDLANTDVLTDETQVIKKLLPKIKCPALEQQKIIARADEFISIIRKNRNFSIEEFINRFSLSTDEGIAIMCLAESLLRIPDLQITKEFVSDKLSNKSWESFLFKKAKSFKTIFSSFGIYFSGKFTDITKTDNAFAKLIDKFGQPVFLKILREAIMYLSKSFVFAEGMESGLKKVQNFSEYKFSFDLLGESARTKKQAARYYKDYLNAINLITRLAYKDLDMASKPNLSVKLTALYPRFEYAKLHDIRQELMPQIIGLIEKIKNSNLTITFDAEESFRLDAYFTFLSEVIEQPAFKNFNGIGLVVQAYQTRSYELLEKIILLAKKTNKQIPIRLVKGAYWDSEIKHAQVNGLQYYPVFTKKEYTDASYIACAKLMLENNDYIYPQFATHNALTASAIIEIAGNKPYEFEKLYGMGDVLHSELAKKRSVRIYAPIGKSDDLLAYLMRRMLENGANSNFVSKVVSPKIPISALSFNLHDKILNLLDRGNLIPLPENIYPKRKNAMGYDLGYKINYDYIQEKVASYFSNTHKVASIIEGRELITSKNLNECFCPAKIAEKFSDVSLAIAEEIKYAVDSAYKEFNNWSKTTVENRAAILEKVAYELENNKFELYALLIKEGGKSIHDAINEVIEAIDFCRYYAVQAKIIMQDKVLPGPTGERNILSMHPRGVFACISPWNFPLAIFIGQIVAALVTGNTVIAKPAGQTCVIANFAVKLLHKAGIPKAALQLIITSASNISNYVLRDERIAGVAFTGSCETAKSINLTLAERNSGIVPFIAETGGQNAMIVDSSALLEQVTDDVLISAFYSAGQRCSALRVLYIQEEIYDNLYNLIREATEILKIGDTTDFSSDIGAVIDRKSFDNLARHISYMEKAGFKIYSHPQNNSLKDGNYFYPHIIEINSINDIPGENFGPILHIIKYKSNEIDKIIDEINNYGFGLTFGIHSRIETKIEYLRSRIKAGNIYTNRSIVGAKVESQPFGGENKSGTGFKAGGPHYLLKFMLERTTCFNLTAIGGNVELLRTQLEPVS